MLGCLGRLSLIINIKVYNFTFRWGTTTPTRSFTRLSCRKVTEMWFDVMMSYRDIGR